MGIVYHGFRDEEKEMIWIFSERPDGIYYDDVEKLIIWYLTPFQHTNINQEKIEIGIKNLNTEKKRIFDQHYE